MRTTVNFNGRATEIFGANPLVQFARSKHGSQPSLGVRPCQWISPFNVALRLYRKDPKKSTAGSVTCIPISLRARYKLDDLLLPGRYRLHFKGDGWYVLLPCPDEGDRNEVPIATLSLNRG